MVYSFHFYETDDEGTIGDEVADKYGPLIPVTSYRSVHSNFKWILEQLGLPEQELDALTADSHILQIITARVAWLGGDSWFSPAECAAARDALLPLANWETINKDSMFSNGLFLPLLQAFAWAAAQGWYFAVIP